MENIQFFAVSKKEVTYRYLTVRYAGGSTEAYFENGVQIIPPVDPERLVVMSRHESHFQAVSSSEKFWRDNNHHAKLGTNEGAGFFVVEVDPTLMIKVGQVISIDLAKNMAKASRLKM